MNKEKKPKITFRLYNQLNSSYFDLIEGNDETKQTKGLGIVLSKSEIALEAFLKLPKIKKSISIDLKNYDNVVVNCELVSKGEKEYRIDVLMRFFHNSILDKAIIIEAKSINKNIHFLGANDQLNNYINNNHFNELSQIQKENILKIVLTKYENVSNESDTISMAWDELLTMFHENKEKDSLIRDYFNFLTNINGTMKFYEKEVYSIPSAGWSNEAINKSYIYECPNKRPYIIKQKPLYITFRESGGGEMKILYKIEDIIILTPSQEYESIMQFVMETDNNVTNDNPDKKGRNGHTIIRIKEYFQYMIENGIWKENDLPNDEKQIFILSKTNNIELKHAPKPQKNNSFRAYYELSDILQNKIVNSNEVIEDNESEVEKLSLNTI